MSDIYEAVRLSDDSWRIEEGGVRAFLFTGTDRALLVDSGFGKGNIKEVIEEITSLPLMLVNTHVDGDHTGCNSLFDAAYMHPSEMAYYYNKEHNNAPADAEARPLWENDVIDLGTRSFEVILIPGHTPGSIALLDRENRLLLSGDSVSDSAIFMFGSHRNLRAYISSLEKLKRLGGFDTVYPSHGSIPLMPDIIDKLLNTARLLLEGRLEGRTPPFDIPARLYSSDGAMFLYE